MNEQLLQGKVAKIISVRELGINIGAVDGVEQGMVFAVLAETALRVEDPDTHEVLGEIEREKVRVKATEVRERFSICRTFETYETPGILPDIALYTPMLAQRRVRTLNIEDSELPPPLTEDESYVKVGDLVQQVPPED